MDRRGILTKVLMTLMCLTAIRSPLKSAFAAESDSAEEYLAGTGMAAHEIMALDSDARQYIADDLKSADGKDWKVNTEMPALTATRCEQYTVAFYMTVCAFQAESELRVYAVYESSTGIMPTGADSLSLSLGDGFTPYEYGGRMWYKKAGDERWTRGGELTADRQPWGAGLFTGRQLGEFQRKMLVKGCVYCYAGEGTGESDEIRVEYTHIPPKKSTGTGLYVMIVAVTLVVVLILRGRE